MSEYLFCDLLGQDLQASLILENEHAIALASSFFREGHCEVIVKRHIESISMIERK